MMPHEDWLEWEETTRKTRTQLQRVRTSKARYGEDVFRRAGKKGAQGAEWGLKRRPTPAPPEPRRLTWDEQQLARRTEDAIARLWEEQLDRLADECHKKGPTHE